MKKPCRYCDAIWHQSFRCRYKPDKLSKPCKYCHSSEHLSWQCYSNPKRKEQIKKKLKRGRHSFKWTKVRKEWFKENQADYYTCYLCGVGMLPGETTLDHVKPRSRAPHLRYKFENIKPCCWKCNQKKGSKTVDNYIDFT